MPVIILIVSWCAPPSWGAEAYKIYKLRSYEGMDVLCDSYTVQKNDHIWQILRRKGRIAESDFPKFVTILKALNPHIADVDRIYPGQELIVPLKELPSVEGPSEGEKRYVTIPMIPDVLYKDRTVRRGDSVSKILMARLGVGWYDIPREYIRAFKRLNPHIKNLAEIQPGQVIHIPEPFSEEPPEGGPALPLDEIRAAPTPQREPIGAEAPPSEEDVRVLLEVVSRGVSELDGKLLASGLCYFPVKGGEDLQLDLNAFPVVEMEDGRHLILETWEGLPEDLDMAISAFWKDLAVVPADPRATHKVVLDRVYKALLGDKLEEEALRLLDPESGIEIIVRGSWIFPLSGTEKKGDYKCVTLLESTDEFTSPSMAAYLAEADIQVVDILSGESKQESHLSQKEHRKKCRLLTIDGSAQEPFVTGFAKALGYAYEPAVAISFDYAGFQVETTANLVYGGKGLDLVVDFGTFYGETLSAVEAMGIQVLSIKPDERPIPIAKGILALAGIAYTEDPILLAANRQISEAPSVTIPGILISGVDESGLLTEAPLHPQLFEFLGENGITLWQIQPSS
jgi:hypothetical protein